MAQEKVARLSVATVSFTPQGGNESITLGYQQSVSLNRTIEKKELLSNDESLGETVMELETKAEYNFSTEIGDVSIGNVDITIIAERPKLAPYIDKMRENIAMALEMPIGAVNVKATTTEKLGFTGREEGIAAQAVCTIEGRF